MGISGKGAKALLESKGWEITEDQDADLTIISPGIPPIEGTIGEAELAMRYVQQPVVGITGSNGKTTLALLVAHILGGRALGNIGESLAGYLVHPKDEIIIAELSSFQLETMTTRALDVAAITTITPDHLDRYDGFEAYAEAKWRIGECLKKGGKIFTTREVAKQWNRSCDVIDDFYLQLWIGSEYFESTRIGSETAAFALAITAQFGVEIDEAMQKIATFSAPPHRLEFVLERNGIAYYNDSKGTNVDAVLYAVRELERPIVLLAGGQAKGACFTSWQKPFRGKVKRVIAFGEAAGQLESELESVTRVASLEEAVEVARSAAEKGDAILLSPGCASFDMFKNFEHRGEVFKQLVGKE